MRRERRLECDRGIRRCPGIGDGQTRLGQIDALTVGALVLRRAEGSSWVLCRVRLRTSFPGRDCFGKPPANLAMTEAPFRGPGDPLMSRVAPARRKHTPGHGVELWHKQMPVPSARFPVGPRLLMLDEDAPVPLEPELAGQVIDYGPRFLTACVLVR